MSFSIERYKEESKDRIHAGLTAFLACWKGRRATSPRHEKAGGAACAAGVWTRE
jgi:hypothetical protein